MTYQLSPSESATVLVDSAACYSADELAVTAGEQYEFSCDPGEPWNDWWVKPNADGYSNPLASLWGQRLRGAKCFCLCGAYDEDDRTAFAIGSRLQLTAAQSGKIRFFANDARHFYFNNKGALHLTIKRI